MHLIFHGHRVRTHESDSEVTVRRLGRMMQRILSAQSGASIRKAVWKCSRETRFPGALATFLENFRCYDFCPVNFVSPRLTAPASPRMGNAMLVPMQRGTNMAAGAKKWSVS